MEEGGPNRLQCPCLTPAPQLLFPEALLLSGEGSGVLHSLLCSLGSNCSDLIWSLDRPGGLTEGTADGCPSLSVGWHAAPMATVGPPCRPALPDRGQCPRPEPGWQMGREGPQWPGRCERGRARQRLLFLRGTVAVLQRESSGCFSSALSFLLGLPAHRQVRSLEPGEEMTYLRLQPGS